MQSVIGVIVLLTAVVCAPPLLASRDEAMVVPVTASNMRSLGLHLDYFRSELLCLDVPASVRGAPFTQARLELLTGQGSLTVPVAAEPAGDRGARMRVHFWGNRKSLQDCRLLIRYGVAWEEGGTLYILQLRDFVSAEPGPVPESYGGTE